MGLLSAKLFFLSHHQKKGGLQLNIRIRINIISAALTFFFPLLAYWRGKKQIAFYDGFSKLNCIKALGPGDSFSPEEIQVHLVFLL